MAMNTAVPVSLSVFSSTIGFVIDGDEAVALAIYPVSVGNPKSPARI